METTKKEYCLLVEIKTDSQFSELGMDLTAEVKELRDGHQIRNLSDHGYDADPLSGITIREHKFFSSYEDKTEVLSWEETTFQHFGSGSRLETVERAYKILKKISSGMNKIYEKEGNAVDFAEKLKRLASILNIKKFSWKINGNSGWYDKDDYMVADLKDAIEYIRHTVKTDKRWNEELEIKGIKKAA
jgi:hypothetical protein